MAIDKASKRGGKAAAAPTADDEVPARIDVKGSLPEPKEEPAPSAPAARKVAPLANAREKGATHVLLQPVIVGGVPKAIGAEVVLTPPHARSLEAQGAVRRI